MRLRKTLILPNNAESGTLVFLIYHRTSRHRREGSRSRTSQHGRSRSKPLRYGVWEFRTRLLVRICRFRRVSHKEVRREYIRRSILLHGITRPCTAKAVGVAKVGHHFFSWKTWTNILFSSGRMSCRIFSTSSLFVAPAMIRPSVTANQPFSIPMSRSRLL
ncbi:MAG: hypothetical protein XD88_0749 [Methanocalculus sp. 52_23]|nr:MAG: hypothetical protein XD88_0749 [Methanocalculus sp. 52_23]